MSDVTSINCTTCGAGLDVLGGGRVTTHICGYCGSELDANADYKTLRKLEMAPRPASPFRIGMTGKIKGVDWTIIGTLGMEETWGYQTWVWVDHMLFSPTHGYAWLTVEDRHLLFTRRMRGLGTRVWMTEAWVERADNRPAVKANGEKFRYYETSNSKITHAEGEFNWRPLVGETRKLISALGASDMLTFSQINGEREIDRTEYLPFAETIASFGNQNAPAPVSVHATQPYVAKPNSQFLGMASAIFAAVCFFLAVSFMSDGGERALGVRTVPISQMPQEFTFDVPKLGQLTRVRFDSDVRDGWAFVEATVFDPEDQPVFTSGRTLERYRGYSEGERWSEGSGGSTLRFRPELTGTYTIELEVSETGKWFGSGIRKDSAPALASVSLSVQNGIGSAWWPLGLAVLFGGFAALQLGGRFLHNRRRWAGSDWVDEDED